MFIPTALLQAYLCELGHTFSSTMEKAKICSSLLDAGVDFGKILCAAVDHSDYFLRGGMKLLEADNTLPYRDYADWHLSMLRRG